MRKKSKSPKKNLNIDDIDDIFKIMGNHFPKNIRKN